MREWITRHRCNDDAPDATRVTGVAPGSARLVLAGDNVVPLDPAQAEAEAWMTGLRSGSRPLAMSTARQYEVTVRVFCEYLVDPRYGWVEVCVERFGQAPEIVFHEGNSVLHSAEYEGDPRRRPLTYDEVQALFDAAGGLPDRIRSRGRKARWPRCGTQR